MARTETEAPDTLSEGISRDASLSGSTDAGGGGLSEVWRPLVDRLRPFRRPTGVLALTEHGTLDFRMTRKEPLLPPPSL